MPFARLALFVCAAGLAGCEDRVPPPLPETAPVVLDSAIVADAPVVIAELDGRVTGRVRLTEYPGGVRIQADLAGLRRDQRHGFQILDGRDCGADPDVHLGHGAAPHGPRRAPAGRRHAGDLGNVDGDDSGRGRYERVDPLLTLSGPRSAVGRAIVVRADPDDGFTLPAGGAGDVIGCGLLSPP